MMEERQYRQDAMAGGMVGRCDALNILIEHGRRFRPKHNRTGSRRNSGRDHPVPATQRIASEAKPHAKCTDRRDDGGDYRWDQLSTFVVSRHWSCSLSIQVFTETNF
jgi:hypothetical protein